MVLPSPSPHGLLEVADLSTIESKQLSLGSVAKDTVAPTTSKAASSDTMVDDQSDNESVGAALYVATSILQQALDFLNTSITDEAQLVYESKLLPGSTIGKHFRHARDHFNLLTQCISQKPPYVLSYDVRTRDTPMERSLSAALSSLQTSIDDLTSLLSGDIRDGSLAHGQSEFQMKSTTPISLHAVTPFPQVFQTSLGRELWFVALHAIHHYATVRTIAGEQGLTVDETFGVAPSTLRYRERAKI